MLVEEGIVILGYDFIEGWHFVISVVKCQDVLEMFSEQFKVFFCIKLEHGEMPHSIDIPLLRLLRI